MNCRWVPLSSLRDAVRMALTGQLKTTAESIRDVSYLFVLWVEKKAALSLGGREENKAKSLKVQTITEPVRML